MTSPRIQRALISVFDKKGVVELGRFLADRGVDILSTGGTYRALSQANIPVREVSDYTGFPEMMDGRVKTLHPRIHGGLLQLRDDEEHRQQAAEHSIPPIDLVVVNLYPFEATCDRPGVSLEEKIEQIDIGGPSMLRSAAKNHRFVTVLTDPADYERLTSEMVQHHGSTTQAFRSECARKVFRTTSRYDALIADELTREAAQEDPAVLERENLPQQFALPLSKVQDLRYGENPHQKAAFYDLRVPGANGLVQAKQLHGKELSYNNLMDADASWRLVREFDRPAAAVIKHTNPCGCAVGATVLDALNKAFAGDPEAAFGSIIAVNREVDANTAAALAEGRFVEVILAPAFSPQALEILTQRPKWKANVRLLSMGEVTPLPKGLRSVRAVLGGLLVQDYDVPAWEPRTIKVVSKRLPTELEMADLSFAWVVVKHLTSNAIAICKEGMLVGPGVGQMSRVNSAFMATKLAGDRAKGSVLASDAFFPFPDALETAAAAGITAIVQPGGSKGDDAVIAAADRLGLAMILTGTRHFRH